MTGIDRRQDRLWTAGVGFIALATYVRTLAPGLTSDPDSAMFQFIGRVLGVAHNPGYPLYVLLTHAFSYLPIGSLAYRINLFSALCGAIAVSLMFLASRRLGCGRLVSAGAALGFAFGSVFWSQAVVAEVYTLNAAIVAGMMVALLTWSETRRPRWYYTAVALFAAGLGHHTTIVGFAPGMALFVLLVDRRFVLRLRTLIVTAGILTAGLLQYLFILLRSSQPDAYVESRATTLGELAKIVLGRQFQDRLFAFGWHELLVKRIPMFAKTIFLPDMTVVGAALGVIGIVWLLRRRVSAAILLATGAVAIVAFALSYSVIDSPCVPDSCSPRGVAAGCGWSGASRLVAAGTCVDRRRKRRVLSHSRLAPCHEFQVIGSQPRHAQLRPSSIDCSRHCQMARRSSARTSLPIAW